VHSSDLTRVPFSTASVCCGITACVVPNCSARIVPSQCSRYFRQHFESAHPEYQYEIPTKICRGCNVVFRSTTDLRSSLRHLPDCTGKRPYVIFTPEEILKLPQIPRLYARDVAGTVAIDAAPDAGKTTCLIPGCASRIPADQKSRVYTGHFMSAHPEYQYHSPAVVCRGCDVIFRNAPEVYRPPYHLPGCTTRTPYGTYTLEDLQRSLKHPRTHVVDVPYVSKDKQSVETPESGAPAEGSGSEPENDSDDAEDDEEDGR